MRGREEERRKKKIDGKKHDMNWFFFVLLWFDYYYYYYYTSCRSVSQLYCLIPVWLGPYRHSSEKRKTKIGGSTKLAEKIKKKKKIFQKFIWRANGSECVQQMNRKRNKNSNNERRQQFYGFYTRAPEPLALICVLPPTTSEQWSEF